MNLNCGLPQGLSLGPLKFVIYMYDAEMQEVVNRHENIVPWICCMHVYEIHVGKCSLFSGRLHRRQ